MTGALAVGRALVTGIPLIYASGGLARGQAIVNGGPGLVINPDYALVAGESPNLFKNKLVGETVNISMDMSEEIPPGVSILSVSVSSGLIIGVDPAPDTLLTGGAVKMGNVIVQRAHGGIAGNTYAVSFLMETSDGQIIIAQGFLPVSAF